MAWSPFIALQLFCSTTGHSQLQEGLLLSPATWSTCAQVISLLTKRAGHLRMSTTSTYANTVSLSFHLWDMLPKCLQAKQSVSTRRGSLACFQACSCWEQDTCAPGSWWNLWGTARKAPHSPLTTLCQPKDLPFKCQQLCYFLKRHHMVLSQSQPWFCTLCTAAHLHCWMAASVDLCFPKD